MHFRTEEKRHEGVHVIVQAGDRWWIREPGGKGHTNEGDPNVRVGFGPGPELLRPRPLLGSTFLQYVEEATIAGRRVGILRASPRPDGDFGRWWGSGDPFDVAIDLERGIALRAHGIDDRDHSRFTAVRSPNRGRGVRPANGHPWVDPVPE